MLVCDLEQVRTHLLLPLLLYSSVHTWYILLVRVTTKIVKFVQKFLSVRCRLLLRGLKSPCTRCLCMLMRRLAVFIVWFGYGGSFLSNPFFPKVLILELFGKFVSKYRVIIFLNSKFGVFLQVTINLESLYISFFLTGIYLKVNERNKWNVWIFSTKVFFLH